MRGERALSAGFGGELETRDGAGAAGSPAWKIRTLCPAQAVAWDFLVGLDP